MNQEEENYQWRSQFVTPLENASKHSDNLQHHAACEVSSNCRVNNEVTLMHLRRLWKILMSKNERSYFEETKLCRTNVVRFLENHLRSPCQWARCVALDLLCGTVPRLEKRTDGLLMPVLPTVIDTMSGKSPKDVKMKALHFLRVFGKHTSNLSGFMEMFYSCGIESDCPTTKIACFHGTGILFDEDMEDENYKFLVPPLARYLKESSHPSIFLSSYRALKRIHARVWDERFYALLNPAGEEAARVYIDLLTFEVTDPYLTMDAKQDVSVLVAEYQRKRIKIRLGKAFGIVDPDLLDRIAATRDCNRALMASNFETALKQSTWSEMDLESHVPDLIKLVAALLADSNRTVQVSGLEVLKEVVLRMGFHVTPHLGSVVEGLKGPLISSNSKVRVKTEKVLSKLMRNVHPMTVIWELLRAANDVDHKEAVLRFLVSRLKSVSYYELDLVNLCRCIGQCGTAVDSSPGVRSASKECVALLLGIMQSSPVPGIKTKAVNALVRDQILLNGPLKVVETDDMHYESDSYSEIATTAPSTARTCDSSQAARSRATAYESSGSQLSCAVTCNGRDGLLSEQELQDRAKKTQSTMEKLYETAYQYNISNKGIPGSDISLCSGATAEEQITTSIKDTIADHSTIGCPNYISSQRKKWDIASPRSCFNLNEDWESGDGGGDAVGASEVSDPFEDVSKPRTPRSFACDLGTGDLQHCRNFSEVSISSEMQNAKGRDASVESSSLCTLDEEETGVVSGNPKSNSQIDCQVEQLNPKIFNFNILQISTPPSTMESVQEYFEDESDHQVPINEVLPSAIMVPDEPQEHTIHTRHRHPDATNEDIARIPYKKSPIKIDSKKSKYFSNPNEIRESAADDKKIGKSVKSFTEVCYTKAFLVKRGSKKSNTYADSCAHENITCAKKNSRYEFPRCKSLSQLSDNFTYSDQSDSPEFNTVASSMHTGKIVPKPNPDPIFLRKTSSSEISIHDVLSANETSHLKSNNANTNSCTRKGNVCQKPNPVNKSNSGRKLLKKTSVSAVTNNKVLNPSKKNHLETTVKSARTRNVCSKTNSGTVVSKKASISNVSFEEMPNPDDVFKPIDTFDCCKGKNNISLKTSLPAPTNVSSKTSLDETSQLQTENTTAKSACMGNICSKTNPSRLKVSKKICISNVSFDGIPNPDVTSLSVNNSFARKENISMKISSGSNFSNKTSIYDESMHEISSHDELQTDNKDTKSARKGNVFSKTNPGFNCSKKIKISKVSLKQKPNPDKTRKSISTSNSACKRKENISVKNNSEPNFSNKTSKRYGSTHELSTSQLTSVNKDSSSAFLLANVCPEANIVPTCSVSVSEVSLIEIPSLRESSQTSSIPNSTRSEESGDSDLDVLPRIQHDDTIEDQSEEFSKNDSKYSMKEEEELEVQEVITSYSISAQGDVPEVENTYLKSCPQEDKSDFRGERSSTSTGHKYPEDLPPFQKGKEIPRTPPASVSEPRDFTSEKQSKTVEKKPCTVQSKTSIEKTPKERTRVSDVMKENSVHVVVETNANDGDDFSKQTDLEKEPENTDTNNIPDSFYKGCQWKRDLEYATKGGTCAWAQRFERNAEEMQAFPSLEVADAAMKRALEDLFGKAWKSKEDAMSNVIRIAKHHPDLAFDNMPKIMVAVCKEVKNFRQSVAGKAILTAGHLYAIMGRKLENKLRQVVGALLAKSGNRTLAAYFRLVIKSLFKIVQHSSLPKAALAFVHEGSRHPNKASRETAAQFLAVLTETIGSKNTLGSPLASHMIKCASLFVFDCSPLTRYCGKRMLHVFMSSPSFEKLKDQHLDVNTTQNLSKVLEQIETKGVTEETLPINLIK